MQENARTLHFDVETNDFFYDFWISLKLIYYWSLQKADTNETKKIIPIAHSTPKFHLTPTRTPTVKSGVNKLSNTFSKKKIIFVVSLYFLKGGNAFSCWKQNSK
uniref:Uncharacterized protein n=1 Tax=Lactuca sativa TaxID=4236 RepID=A0A9R1W5E1_LACSA|nr:hypothetical protein LSAT_V11C300128220 [Lactuca sativa]